MEVCDRFHGTLTAKRLTVFLRCEVTRLARNGRAERSNECLMLGGGLNRSTQHLH